MNDSPGTLTETKGAIKLGLPDPGRVVIGIEGIAVYLPIQKEHKGNGPAYRDSE